MNSELLVIENGLQTIDGKGILPGSTLIVKGEVVPPSWTGIVENCGSVKDRKLVVATPDTEKQIAELNEQLEYAKTELQKVPEIVSELATVKAENEKLTAEIAELKKPKSGK